MQNPFPRSLEWYPPVPLPETPQTPRSRRRTDPSEDETRFWCNQFFPAPHSELQMGVVDYLLHGAGDMESKSLQAPDMTAMASYIADVFASREHWPDEGEQLVQSIADIVTEVQRRTYTKGIPETPPLIPPRNDAVTPTVLGVPHRPRASLSGWRVAAIEKRWSTPGGIRSSRLHTLSAKSAKGAKKNAEVDDMLRRVGQPL